MSIVTLLNDIRNGEVVLPAIQRDFVWPEERIERLLDSVLRGYPIGIALLWETYLDVQHREFTRDYQPGHSHVFRDNAKGRRLKLVLDGQQRLQSLYLALYGSYAGKTLYFDVLSGRETEDLAEQMYGFSLLTGTDAEEHNNAAGSRGVSHLVSVRMLHEAGAKERKALIKRLINEMVLDEDGEDRLRTNLDRFYEMLTRNVNALKLSVIDENLPSASADRKSEADVLEIFVRINREGTPLSRSDLIFSMLKLGWQESANTLPDFVREINRGNSLGLDADFVIRCLFAVCDLGTKFDVDLLRKRANIGVLKDRFPSCCDAIRSAIDFVVSECGIASSTLLGGANTLVPLVYYLFHTPKHTIPHAQVLDVRKAVFLFAFAKPFSRYGEGRLSRFIRDHLQKPLKAGNYGFPFVAAVRLVGYWEGYSEVDERLLRANVLLTHHVVQNLSGAKNLYAPNAPELDHIFPRSELRTGGKGFSEDEINHVANFWILSKGKNQNKGAKHPASYFADVPDAVLKRALIDRGMLDYRRYRTFLRIRSQALAERVRARIGFTDEDFAHFNRDGGNE